MGGWSDHQWNKSEGKHRETFKQPPLGVTVSSTYLYQVNWSPDKFGLVTFLKIPLESRCSKQNCQTKYYLGKVFWWGKEKLFCFFFERGPWHQVLRDFSCISWIGFLHLPECLFRYFFQWSTELVSYGFFMNEFARTSDFSRWNILEMPQNKAGDVSFLVKYDSIQLQKWFPLRTDPLLFTAFLPWLSHGVAISVTGKTLCMIYIVPRHPNRHRNWGGWMTGPKNIPTVKHQISGGLVWQEMSRECKKMQTGLPCVMNSRIGTFS